MKPERIWSEEQRAIFEFFQSPPEKNKKKIRNGVIAARAGTGKTSTIIEAFRYAPEQRIVYVVFNKRNQKEAAAKVSDRRIEVRTLHSLGLKMLQRVNSRTHMDDGVEFERATQACRLQDAGHKSKRVTALVVKLVGLYKNRHATLDRNSIAILNELAVEHSLAIPSYQTGPVIDIATAAYKSLDLAMGEEIHRISFDDMVWLPVARGLVEPLYDLVVVDEAQDMNLPQLLMAQRASRGRVIVVGDDRQAIYGFRGAVQDALRWMTKELDAVTLTLTTTYRCPALVVALANAVVSDYKAAPTAPAGVVARRNDAGDATAGDAVLSRLNAPLMPMALSLLRQRKPVRIEGRDLGSQLLTMSQGMKATTIPAFIAAVESWRSDTVSRLIMNNVKDCERRSEQACDIAQTLTALAEGCGSVQEIEQRITTLFADTAGDSDKVITLSSVHRAKGLEWKSVYVLCETFIRTPKPGGMKVDKREEDNIWYVAITRSMANLYLINYTGEIPEIATREPLAPAKGCAPSRRPLPTRSGAPKREDVDPWHEVTKAERFRRTPQPLATSWRDDWNLPVGAAYYQVGDVKDNCVCVLVNSSRARWKPLGKNKVKIKDREIEMRGSEFDTCNTYEESLGIPSRMTNDEMQDQFVSGRRAAKSETMEQTTDAAEETNSNQQQENDNMKTKNKNTKKTKTPAGGKSATPSSRAGSAEFVRKLYTDGTNKAKAKETAQTKYPSLTDEYFERRWNTAERIAKNSAAKAKEAAKPKAKAPARSSKSAPAKKPAAKKIVKKSPAPAHKKSTPPARPVPARAEVVDEPEAPQAAE